ncbi:RNA exonuclease 3 [Irineochytrium annulatum]|nr:RNA exonuclease 3 [Irineochytrium annulatum]
MPRPPASSIAESGIDGEWVEPVETPAASKANKEVAIEDYTKVCLSVADMVKGGYSLSERHGGPPFIAKTNPRENCDRCGTSFAPKLFISDADKTECKFHPQHAKSKKLSQQELGKEKVFPCCDGNIGTEGCETGPHVFKLSGYHLLNEKIPFRPLPDRVEKAEPLVACDCEMSYTSGGMELTRVTFLDRNGNTLLDELVRTRFPVVDHNTRWSGISTLESARFDLDGIHREMAKFMSSSTIIVGHGLENDLDALRLTHFRVIDTALLFPIKVPIRTDKGGLITKHSLKYLSNKILQRKIQAGTGGHDSKQDAVAALDLARVYVQSETRKFSY